MKLHFSKYQGTGNDFILIDNRTAGLTLSRPQIAIYCHRHYGIGANGLMLLEKAHGYDFRMKYYNCDGKESTMCGNGGRCIAAFAVKLGIVVNECSFVAADGVHKAMINPNGTISLSMQDVYNIKACDGYMLAETGSPHYVTWVSDVATVDVRSEGRRIRNEVSFRDEGINVNFVQTGNCALHIRTYERGVEDETMSCGTGVTAAAIAATGAATGRFSTEVHTRGGMLNVSFTKNGADCARNVVLTGPARCVFEGNIELD